MEKICPKCGAKSDDKKFIKNFCEDCFTETIEIKVPHKIEIPYCKTCGKLKLEHWKPLNDENVSKFLTRFVKSRYKNMRFILPNGYEGTAYVVVLVPVGDDFVEITKSFETRLKPELCDDCSRKSSGYFEAIIQIRGDQDAVARSLKKLRRELQKKTFIAKLEEVQNGVDVYVASNKATKGIIAKYHYSPTVSSTLYGVKDGQRVYRITYCIRV